MSSKMSEFYKPVAYGLLNIVSFFYQSANKLY